MNTNLAPRSQPSHAFMVAIVVGVMLLAAGCDKYTDSGQTVGQKLDKAIDNTNAKIAAAGDKVEKKVEQAGAAVASAGESISNTTGAAVDKAGMLRASFVDASIEDMATITALLIDESG